MRDQRPPHEDRLDRVEDLATFVGLLASGIVFAAGLAALLYVIDHVTATTPPSFGSQGEWLYGAATSLLVAGWGFAQAARFYARRRRAVLRRRDPLTPRLRSEPAGWSIELGAPRPPGDGESQPFTWSWSTSRQFAPPKTIEITEAQLAAAEALVRRGLAWDAVARETHPDYAGWSPFERELFVHALRISLDRRRQPG